MLFIEIENSIKEILNKPRIQKTDYSLFTKLVKEYKESYGVEISKEYLIGLSNGSQNKKNMKVMRLLKKCGFRLEYSLQPYCQKKTTKKSVYIPAYKVKYMGENKKHLDSLKDGFEIRNADSRCLSEYVQKGNNHLYS